jgi:4-aminobutyrate---pyruvate transaminase
VGVAVALEAIRIYEEMDVVAHVRRLGAPLRGHFEAMAETSPIVGQVRAPG